jgi:hypothetical protein
MRLAKRFRCRYTGGPSEALKRLGKKMAEEQGIKPLKPGEKRPYGYYTVDHFWGTSAPAGSVVKED